MPRQPQTPDPTPGEPERSPTPTPALSPQQRQQLLELGARVKEGRDPDRPKRPRLTSEQASAKARAYWSTLGPTERHIRMLAARISTGKAAERELQELLQQLQAQQQGDAGEGTGDD